MTKNHDNDDNEMKKNSNNSNNNKPPACGQALHKFKAVEKPDWDWHGQRAAVVCSGGDRLLPEPALWPATRVICKTLAYAHLHT